LDSAGKPARFELLQAKLVRFDHGFGVQIGETLTNLRDLDHAFGNAGFTFEHRILGIQFRAEISVQLSAHFTQRAAKQWGQAFQTKLFCD
jgi:hypothetical protein